MNDTNIPYGWTYNPSDWSQRWPIVVLAMVGFVIASYLAMFQYGVFKNVFEPFFGDGSRVILMSELSHILPITDAALGALAYLADAVTGIIGGKKRWQTMPWVVIIFGILVGPLGAVSIGLVIAQPLLYDAWCILCLLSAAISIIMIGPSMDEVLACLQYLRRVDQRKNHSVWKVFWGLERDEEPYFGTPIPKQKSIIWAQIFSTGAGIWLMAAPDILQFGGAAQKNAYVIGPLVATFGIIALWDATREVRWVNVFLGAWLVAAGFILNHLFLAMVNSLMIGLALIFFSFHRGSIHTETGDGWRKVI